MAMALEVCASQGPLRCSDLLNCYWVLAHRARNVAMDLPAYARDTPLDALQQVDASTRQLYEQLRQFWSDRDGFAEFRPRGGFERRAFRVLCNEFGFRHKVVRVTNTATNMSTWEHVDSYETVVKVWKPPNVPTDFEPPSFEELIARDANLNPNQRNLDGEPLYWPQACAALDVMDEEKLAVVVGRLGNAMKNYASTSWMLLFADKLREREVPLPLGLLRSIMKMAAERNDLYGLLEVLHLCLQEKEIAEQSKELKLSPYAQNLQRIRLRPRYHSSTQRSSRRHQQPTDGPSFAGVETDEDEDDVGPEPGLGPDASRLVDSLLATEEEGQVDVWALEFDSLTKHDWNRACLLAFRGKQSHVPLESYKEAFTEVMVLMRQCGVELEKDSLQTLMRFLVFSNHNPDLLWKLVKRMHKDKSIEISHVECVALTQLVARQLHPAHRGYLQLVLPMYQSQNYLHAFPETLHQISGLVVRNAYHLGPDFLRSFESAWASLQTARGRNSLHKMMTRLLDDSTQAQTGTGERAGEGGDSVRRALVEAGAGLGWTGDREARGGGSGSVGAASRGVGVRDAVALVSTYSAYLMGAHEGSYRKAFDLLYEVAGMYQETDEFWAALEEEDDNSIDKERRDQRRDPTGKQYHNDNRDSRDRDRDDRDDREMY